MTASLSPAVYHLKGKRLSMTTVGQLQQSEGVYVLVVSARQDDLALIREHERAKQQMRVEVEVANQIVAVMPVFRVRAKAGLGAHVDLWIIVG